MSGMKSKGLAVKCDGSINGITNSSLQGKFIELNGEKYVKVSKLRPDEVITNKLVEYVNFVNIKEATLEEIDILIRIANVLRF